MKYTSIVPSEMSNKELVNICSDIQIAKNCNLKQARVELTNGLGYHIDVEDLKDYQEEIVTECGALTI